MDMFEVALHKKGYKDIKILGRGAVAQVYCVEKQGTGEQFACKVSEQAELLEREFAYMQQVSHPLFPKGYQFWQESGVGFLVMEYVPGSNLAEALARRGHFSVTQTIRVGMELAEGLLYLQESGGVRIFRDVKPENIMVRQDGRIKLLDFGCVCQLGEIADFRAGSPGFAAPEQFEFGASLDLSCDVYGLGRTLEAMLDGRENSKIKNPRRGKLGFRRRREDKKVQRILRKLIEACTFEEPSKRLPDMRAVKSALADLCEETAGRKRVWKSFGPGFGVECIKNIWESDYKTLDV